MNVAVLIPTRERRADLLETLVTVARQTHPVAAAVVVDSSVPQERARTRAAIAEQAAPFPVAYVETDRVGMTVQRNIALAHVPPATEIVLWLDDDVLLEPDHVAEIVRVFAADRERRIGGVAGVFQRPERSREPRWLPLYRRAFFLAGRGGSLLPSGINIPVERDDDAVVPADWLYGCAAYRVEVGRELVFDEGLGRYALLEDVEYSCRVGRRWRLVVNTAARLFHKRSPSGRVSAREIARLHVRNRLRILVRHAWSPRYALAFAWSTLGIFLEHVGLFIVKGDAEQRDRALGTVEGVVLCLRGDHLRP